MSVEFKFKGDPVYVDRIVAAVYHEIAVIAEETFDRFPPVVVDEIGTYVPPRMPVTGRVKFTGKDLARLRATGANRP